MSAIQKFQDPAGLPVNSLQDALGLGEVLAKSGYFKDAGSAAQAVVKILAGQELGIPPVAAMRGIHIVEGKPEVSASMLGALVQRSGRYRYQVQETTDTVCKIEFQQIHPPNMPMGNQKVESLGVSSFSMDDAKRAGLAGRNVWKSYPKAMLFSRAMTQGVRAFCPEVSLGALYAEGEAREALEVEAEEVPQKTQTQEVRAQIVDDSPADELAQLTAELSGLCAEVSRVCTPEQTARLQNRANAILEGGDPQGIRFFMHELRNVIQRHQAAAQEAGGDNE